MGLQEAIFWQYLEKQKSKVLIKSEKLKKL